MKNAQYSCFSIQKSRLLVNGQLFIRKGGFLSKGVFNIGYFKINEILICMSLRSKTFMSKRTMRIRVILENQFYKQMYQTRLKSLLLKVSQGEARGARTNFFQLSWQKFYKLISTIISIIVINFVDFEANFLTLFKGKVIKNPPKHKIVWQISNRFRFSCHLSTYSTALCF